MLVLVELITDPSIGFAFSVGAGVGSSAIGTEVKDSVGAPTRGAVEASVAEAVGGTVSSSASVV